MPGQPMMGNTPGMGGAPVMGMNAAPMGGGMPMNAAPMGGALPVPELHPKTEGVDGELVDVSVGSNAWGVNRNDDIYRRDNGVWTQVPGKLCRITCSDDGTVLGVNRQDGIFRFVGGQWQQLPGQLVDVSAGSSQHIWGVNRLGSLYKWDLNNNKWQQVSTATIPGGDCIADVSVGADGTAFVVTKNQKIYQYNTMTQTFSELPGALVCISVLHGGAVVGCNAQGKCYQLSPPNKWNEITGIPPKQTRVSVGTQGVWFVGTDQRIHSKKLNSPQMSAGGMSAMGSMMGNMMGNMMAATTAMHSNMAQNMAAQQQINAQNQMAMQNNAAMMGGGTMMGGSGIVGLCKKCNGKGGMGAFGPVTQGEIHYKGPCPNCDGTTRTTRHTECHLCKGKGGLGAFGPCDIMPRSVHFRSACNACSGRGYV